MTFGSTSAAFQDLVDPEDRAHVLKTINDAIQNRSPYDLECPILRQDHPGEAWIAITGQVLPDSTGHPRQITGVMFDITEREYSVAALQQSEQQLPSSPMRCPVSLLLLIVTSGTGSSTRGTSNSSDCHATRSWVSR
ncbi:MAG: PAS domain-containing protein [Nitrospira sp.]